MTRQRPGFVRSDSAPPDVLPVDYYDDAARLLENRERLLDIATRCVRLAFAFGAWTMLWLGVAVFYGATWALVLAGMSAWMTFAIVQQAMETHENVEMLDHALDELLPMPGRLR